MSRRPPDSAVTVERSVPFHHVDMLHIVWHGHYMAYFEEARLALFRSRGLDVADVIKMGHRLVIVESRCRHSFPLHYGDRFAVSAWFADTEHRIKVRYAIENLTHGRRAAHGHTVVATTDATGALLLHTPEDLREKLV